MLSEKYTEALDFARELHHSQYRKRTHIPYFSHLIAVSSIVLEHGGTEEEAIAGLLHDAIEDKGPDYDPGGSDGLRKEITDRFGPDVLAIVEECTDADTDPKPAWRIRKEAYLAHIKTASKSGLLVSAAD